MLEIWKIIVGGNTRMTGALALYCQLQAYKDEGHKTGWKQESNEKNMR